MIRFVNAKINIGLNIVGKRADGYHDLETVFYPVGLYNGTPENPQPFGDILEIHLLPNGNEDEFVFCGNHIGCRLEDNLVYKAAQLFRNELKAKNCDISYFNIYLDKHIADGAGLGGGSADATFTLLALNELSGLPFDKAELINMAAKLGADCPFFVENRPVFAQGKGEIMNSIELNLKNYWALILKPNIYVSTKEAFSNIIPEVPSTRITDILSSPPNEWEERGLANDFETGIFKFHPELAELKSRLYESGALYASMSGSGSSIYGIFPSEESASNALSRFCAFNIPGLKSYICKL